MSKYAYRFSGRDIPSSVYLVFRETLRFIDGFYLEGFCAFTLSGCTTTRHFTNFKFSFAEDATVNAAYMSAVFFGRLHMCVRFPVQMSSNISFSEPLVYQRHRKESEVSSSKPQGFVLNTCLLSSTYKYCIPAEEKLSSPLILATS